jgi:hypothetical protein
VSAPVSTAGRELAASRAKAPHTPMLLRMLVRAAILRRGRAVSALFAMVVAAAVATAMLNLYVDVQAKLRTEFRNYGANIVLVGKDDASLPSDALEHVDSIVKGHGIAAPFGMVVARTSDGQPIVVAGTDFDRVKQLDRWWKVSAWPENPHFSQSQQEVGHPLTQASVESSSASYGSRNPSPVAEDATRTAHPDSAALVGVRALAVVSPKNQPFDLSFQGRDRRGRG